MLYRWIAALVLAVNLVLVLPASAASQPRAGAARTSQTSYVFGFTDKLPPFNKVLLATFPPGTRQATIDAFVRKEMRTGLYTSVRVFPYPIP